MNSAAYGCAQSHFRNCRMFDEATEEFPAGARAHLLFLPGDHSGERPRRGRVLC